MSCNRFFSFQNFKREIKNIVQCFVLQLGDSQLCLDPSVQNIVQKYLVKILDKLDQPQLVDPHLDKIYCNNCQKKLDLQTDTLSNHRTSNCKFQQNNQSKSKYKHQISRQMIDSQQSSDYLERFRFVDYTERYNHIVLDQIPSCRKKEYQKVQDIQESRTQPQNYRVSNKQNQFRLRPLDQNLKISDLNISDICQSQMRRKKYDFQNYPLENIENKNKQNRTNNAEINKQGLHFKGVNMQILKLKSPKGKLFQAKYIKRKIFG